MERHTGTPCDPPRGGKEASRSGLTLRGIITPSRFSQVMSLILLALWHEPRPIFRIAGTLSPIRPLGNDLIRGQTATKRNERPFPAENGHSFFPLE